MAQELRKFVAPEFVFGAGARRLAARYARNLGARRPLLVTDPGVRAAGWADSVLGLLREEGLEVIVFDGVTENPKDREVERGVDEYITNGCDVVVAVGGGSPLDCAKGIAIVASNGGAIAEYEGVDRVELPCPPLVCVPTTAGTSADVSQFCIITNSQKSYKMAIVSKAVVPDVALVDSETTTTMDAALTSHTGLDALCHAVEALVSNASSPITEMFALDAITKVFRHLRGAREKPQDIVHRDAMMLASLNAGLAFSNASLGAVHALAHALGGLLDLPHGECNAVLLPHVLAYNFGVARQQYGRMAQAIGIEFTEDNLQQVLHNSVSQLCHDLGVDHGLSAMGVRRETIPSIATTAMNDACIVTNPRKPTVGELEAILEQAF